MKYKKNLKSNKKIKGGVAISNDATKIIYGLYILANIYLKYCIQFRIWCINFFSSTSTDIKTDTSITQFLDMYFTNFEDIYKTTITGKDCDNPIYFNDDKKFNKELFAQAILENYNKLFLKHNKNGVNDFKPFMNKLYIKSNFKLFKELNIIVICDNEELKKKLYELYALYIIALSNHELFMEIRTIYNKLYIPLYYNKSQINEEVIRNCIDFYNNMLYQLLFFDMLNDAKKMYFEQSLDIQNNIDIIKETIYDKIINDVDRRIVLNLRKNATLITFFQTYDTNIEDEINLFVNLGIDEIIQLLNISNQITTTESFNRNLKEYVYDYKTFLVMDRFIKRVDILKKFTELEEIR